MKCRLSNVLQWVALVPSACFVVLWFVSAAFSADTSLWSHQGPQYGVYHDSLQVSFTAYNAIEIASVSHSTWVSDRTSGYYNLRQSPAILGAYVGRVPDGAASVFVIMLPFWLLAVVAGAPSAFVWSRGLRRRSVGDWRWRNGKCVACGYDIRATPDRCPECGKAVKT